MAQEFVAVAQTSLSGGAGTGPRSGPMSRMDSQTPRAATSAPYAMGADGRPAPAPGRGARTQPRVAPRALQDKRTVRLGARRHDTTTPAPGNTVRFRVPRFGRRHSPVGGEPHLRVELT